MEIFKNFTLQLNLSSLSFSFYHQIFPRNDVSFRLRKKKPFKIVSLAIIGRKGGTSFSKRYLHFLVDRFTIYALILTFKTQNANDLIELIETVAKKGKIGQLFSNQYPGINSIQLKNFLNDKHKHVINAAANAMVSIEFLARQ